MALDTLNELLQQGKDVAKLIEDMIFTLEIYLCFIKQHQIWKVLEKVKVDENFVTLSDRVTPQFLYETIEVLNKSHQEMKWDESSKDFL
ncbi:hypothetical protein ACEQPO_30730 [Bacillus sp. SL00103]